MLVLFYRQPSAESRDVRSAGIGPPLKSLNAVDGALSVHAEAVMMTARTPNNSEKSLV